MKSKSPFKTRVKKPVHNKGANAETENPNINLRITPELRDPIAKLSLRSGLPESAIIRLCLSRALPLVERSFEQMDAIFADALKESK